MVWYRIGAKHSYHLITRRSKNFEIKREKIERVTEAIYLGQTISFEDRLNTELSRRINQTWKNFWGLREIYKGKMSINTKAKILESCTIPVLTYGAQTCAPTSKQMERLRVTVRAMERSMMGIKLKDKKKNENIRELTGLKDVGETVDGLKWKYAGHLARMDKTRWCRISNEWIPRDKKRERGRPATRWKGRHSKNYGDNVGKDGAKQRSLEENRGGLCPKELSSVADWSVVM